MQRLPLDVSEGLCVQPRYRDPQEYDWYSEDPYMEMKTRKVCDKCPVKFECAQNALNGREAWGIWGGMEDFRMRRALGLDSMGQNRVYSHELLCPFCFSESLDIAKKKEANGYPVHCNDCGIDWISYRVPDKIRKTLKRQYDTNMANSVGDSRK